jgi:hypothetical protein
MKEVAMRNRHRTAAVVILLSTLAVAGRASSGRVGTLLDRVNTLLLGPTRTEGNAREGFQALLSAITEVSSAVDLPADFRAKLADASRSGVGPKAGTLLGECYRLTHDGAPFRMPEGVHSLEAAVEHARRRLAAARDSVAKGQSRDALGALLEVAMVVATPMEGFGH